MAPDSDESLFYLDATYTKQIARTADSGRLCKNRLTYLTLLSFSFGEVFVMHHAFRTGQDFQMLYQELEVEHDIRSIQGEC